MDRSIFTQIKYASSLKFQNRLTVNSKQLIVNIIKHARYNSMFNPNTVFDEGNKFVRVVLGSN